MNTIASVARFIRLQRFIRQFRSSAVAAPAIVALIVAGSLSLRAQQPLPASAGTEFYTSVPSLAIADNAQIRFLITATASTNVTVTFLDVDTSVTQFIDAGTGWELTIPRGRIEVIGQQETRSDRGLHITSEQPVTIQVFHDAEYFTDGWVLHPTVALGLDHRVMSFGSSNDLNLNGGVAAVIATEDNTTLRITPTVTTASGNSPGFTYGIALAKGEVWQVVPLKPERTDMSGTRLQGDKPIAVISGHRGTEIVAGEDATNPLVETIPPVSQWGREFYATPPPGRDTGHYKIVAAEDNTVVTIVQITGSSTATLNAGGTIEYTGPGPIAVTSSKPILAAEFARHRDTDTTGMNADPSMTLLQPVRGWAQSYLWTTPSLDTRPWPGPVDPERFIPFTHFLMVTASAVSTDPVLLDGMDITANLTQLHPGGAYRSGFIRLEEGTHSLTSSIPVAAQLVGYNHFDAYFLPAGYLVPPPVEAAPLLVIASTCKESFDTVLLLRSMRADTLRLERAAFIDITGNVLSPLLPLDLPPFSERLTAVRINLAKVGENAGTIRLEFAGDSLPDIEVPVRIRRDSLAGVIREDPLLFPDATLGNPARDSLLTIINTGTDSLRIDDFSLAPPFEVIGGTLPATLAPGDTLRLPIRFAPALPGEYQEELVLHTAPCDVSLTTVLRGKRSDPGVLNIAVTDPPRLRCPDEPPGEIIITLSNRGGEPIRLSGGEIEGDDPDEFGLADDLAGKTILPGDSLRITVIAIPADTGERKAIIRIRHDLPPGSTLVEVTAHKDSAGAEITETSIGFDPLVICFGPTVQTSHLRNVGTLPIVIDSIRFVHGEYFSSPSSTPLTVMPGDTEELEIAFAPQEEGLQRDTLLVYISPCNIVLQVPLDGEGRSPDLSTVTDTIDFGSSPFCLLPDTLIARLQNNGSTADTITSIEIIGSGFDLSRLPDPVIPAGEEVVIPIVFEEETPGDYSAELVVRALPCNLERRIVLKGSLRRLSLDTAIPDVELGILLPNVPRQGKTTLHNNGSLPVTIDSLSAGTFPEGLRILSPIFPITIEPGESIELQFDYRPATTEEFATEVSLFTTPCSLPLSFVVRADGGPGRMELIFPDTAANVDAIVRLPLRLEGAEGFNERIHLTASVRWKLRNLLLRQIISGSEGTLQMLSDSIVGEERRIGFDYDGTIPADGQLGSLEVLVLLGLDDSTSLDGTLLLAEHLPSGAKLDVTARDGSFRTLGICFVDGARYVRIDGTLQGSKPRPNPAKDEVIITFFAPQQGLAELALYDHRGEKAASIRNIVESGLNELRLDVSALPSGVYFYRLNMGNEKIEEPLIIGR